MVMKPRPAAIRKKLPAGETQARRLELMYEQLVAMLRQPESTLRSGITPGEDEWSAVQVLGHLVEMIPYWLNQCLILSAATSEPPQFGRKLDAPERLAGIASAVTGRPDELLRQLNFEVEAAAHVLREMSPIEQGKRGVHFQHGEMTVSEVVEKFIITHAEEHLAQAQAALRC